MHLISFFYSVQELIPNDTIFGIIREIFKTLFIKKAKLMCFR